MLFWTPLLAYIIILCNKNNGITICLVMKYSFTSISSNLSSLTNFTLGHSSQTVCCIIWKRPGPKFLVTISCLQLHFRVPGAGLITGLLRVICNNKIRKLFISLFYYVYTKHLDYILMYCISFKQHVLLKIY